MYHLNEQCFFQPSMEDVADGYVDQPIVAIYVPELDGPINPLVDMDVNGSSIHYREWTHRESLEGMQQIIQQRKQDDMEVRAQAVAEADLREKSHDDFSLFVITPEVPTTWYEQLGEVKELTAVLLTSPMSEYEVEAIQKLEAAVSAEHIFHGAPQACVHIERVLHKRGLLK